MTSLPLQYSIILLVDPRLDSNSLCKRARASEQVPTYQLKERKYRPILLRAIYTTLAAYQVGRLGTPTESRIKRFSLTLIVVCLETSRFRPACMHPPVRVPVRRLRALLIPSGRELVRGADHT